MSKMRDDNTFVTNQLRLSLFSDTSLVVVEATGCVVARTEVPGFDYDGF